MGPFGTAPAVGSGRLPDQTLILWDPSQNTNGTAKAWGIQGTAAERTALGQKLAALAGATSGRVVDLSADSRVAALQAQADANPACVYGKNLVAPRSATSSSPTRVSESVVLVGGDSSIPFFRYPDPADLAPESWYVPPVSSSSPSEASLRTKYVLGQDEYGATTILSLGGTRFPVPNLAVGRLVETAAEASGVVQNYLDLNGVAIQPSSSLVTGYDFLTDSSHRRQGSASARDGQSARQPHQRNVDGQ